MVVCGSPIAPSSRDLIREFDDHPIDKNPKAQARLDLVNRTRTSLFPWRGQFSPELVEYLLSEYVPQAGLVADPFLGSGTTLFESARKALNCIGAEIHPAAVTMARTVQFINLSAAERQAICRQAWVLLNEHAPMRFTDGLFSTLEEEPAVNLPSALHDLISAAAQEPRIFSLIANTLISFMTIPGGEVGDLHHAFKTHKRLIEQLPYNQGKYRVFHTDARELPLRDNEADLVITSPPYINVFNYHQNHRPAMELLGWNMLSLAQSEFGSNRKHRGNRFLTVVQYAIDMLAALQEMRRVLKPTGRIILVIGRMSNVRGISFENGRIVAALAAGGAGLQLILRQERKFKNKFGDIIFEDILHFTPHNEPVIEADVLAQKLGEFVLTEASSRATKEVYADIVAAIERARSITASPLFSMCRHRPIHSGS